MEEKKVEIIDFKIEAAKRRAKTMWNSGVQFVKNHETEVIAVGSLVGTMLAKELMLGQKRRAVRKEQNDRELHTYDPRTGEHWYLCRKPTTNQKLEIDRRYTNGESKGKILSDMGLL